MNKLRRNTAMAGVMVVAAMLAGCGMMSNMMGGGAQQLALSGANEVPPVSTNASGTGTVTIGSDRSVTAKISVSGMTATAAHIHEGAAGANGPVIVPLTKTADNQFEAPAGAKLTEAQYASYKAGNLYVNVHSAKNPPGEVRAQLKGN